MFRLSSWLQSVPWVETGGIRVIKTADHTLVPILAETLTRTSRACDPSGWLRIYESLDNPACSLSCAMTQMVSGTPAELNARKLRDRISDVLADHPCIFLIKGERGTARKMYEEASALEDQISKTEVRYPLVIVFFDNAGEPMFPRDDFDLTVGYPIETTLAGMTQTDSEVWGRYLHARTAWEVAGNLDEAQSALGPMVNELQKFDDDALERTFNHYASQRAARLPGDHGTLFGEYMDQLGQYLQPSLTLKLAVIRLIRKGILWRPPERSSPVPTPWYARHLLLTGVSVDIQPLLRHAVLCGPLAREILGACFDVEAQERTAYWKKRMQNSANSETTDECEGKYKDFLDQRHWSAFSFYPKDCPAIPNQSWHFASFGQFFDGLPSDARTDARRQMVRVRNAIAHGHYVGWNLLTVLRKSQVRLSDGLH
jgi:hypothetical protein